MTISPRISSVLRCLLVLTCAFLSLVALNTQSHWLLVLALSFLATLAVLRAPNVFLHWPIGLLALIGAMYGNYAWQWSRGSEGVTKGSASATLLVLIVLSTLVAMLRAITNREQIEIPRLSRVAAVVTVVGLPLVLMVLVTTRWFDEPIRIISGHLGGGDHGPHSEIVHKLLRESGQVNFVSPFQMYSYPQSLHFFIANLVALTRSTTELPLLAQEYAMGAWFEWLQFAAFCQLSIVVFMHKAKSNYRFLFIPVFVFVFAAMDNFVAQLLWSGFTTSIGITWILLAFVVVAEKLFSIETSKQFSQSLVVLVAFGLISWTVYQPYSAIFIFLFALLLGKKLALQKKQSHVVQLINEFISRPLVLLSGVAGSIIVFMLFLLGKDSPAVTSLSLEGATHKPFLYTVLLWAFLAIATTRFNSNANSSDESGVEQFSIIHLGFVAGFAGIVVLTSDYGFLTLPYYLQKMLWILLFVSIPVALMQGFFYLESFLAEKTRMLQTRVIMTLLLAVVMIPLIQGRAPVNSTRHGTVDWFAKSMVLDPKIDSVDSVAFTPLDPLGSHLANLALKSTSQVQFPIDISLKGNSYTACRFINRESIDTIYTSEGAISALANAGCRLNHRFVIDGVAQELPAVPYSDLKFDVEYRTGKSDIGQFTLLRGFNSVEKWGGWASGYLSAVGVKIPDTADNARLLIRIRPSKSGPEEPTVRFLVDNQDVKQIQFFDDKSRVVEIPLGARTKGEKFEIGIDCAWTDEDAAQVTGDVKPKNCLGVESITLLRK